MNCKRVETGPGIQLVFCAYEGCKTMLAFVAGTTGTQFAASRCLCPTQALCCQKHLARYGCKFCHGYKGIFWSNYTRALDEYPELDQDIKTVGWRIRLQLDKGQHVVIVPEIHQEIAALLGITESCFNIQKIKLVSI